VDEEGEIVVTDLKNFAMPMIRYRTRDVGRLKSAACSCGRGLPLLDLAGGRVTDFLIAMNGKKVSGVVLATYVITNIPGVRQVQFVQNAKGFAKINVVKGRDWSPPAEGELIRKAREFLGGDMQVEVEFKDDIPMEKSGKFRFTICTLHG
jgi:phenylacetate-CoA ligase